MAGISTVLHVPGHQFDCAVLMKTWREHYAGVKARSFFVDIGDNLLEMAKPVRNVEKSVKIYS